ncbi:MAG: zinc-binding dehydrogenase, partial [Woeseiaceae bacterium]|nr:zinc-binding dehydrogenase [Woeseiaceae bacterium]
AVLLNPFVDQEFVMLLAELRQDDLVQLADWMAAGQVTPVIDQTFPLAGTADAIRYSETGRARGKIIIDVGQ